MLGSTFVPARTPLKVKPTLGMTFDPTHPLTSDTGSDTRSAANAVQG